MPLHTKAIGERTEARVLAALVERYPIALLPWGENHRFDPAVVDEEGRFLRIQSPTGRLRNGAITFATTSFTYHHRQERPDVGDTMGRRLPDRRSGGLAGVAQLARATDL